MSKFSREDTLPKATFDNDNEIDTLIGGSGGGGKPAEKFEIIRCCTAPNEPWMKLKSKGDGQCQIILPMPMQLKSQETPSWEGEVKGRAGLLLDTVGQTWNYLQQTLQETGSVDGMADHISESLRERIAKGGGIGSIMKSALAGDMNGIAKEQGFAVLPPKELRFQGVSFRSFNFDWKLVPMDQNQSQQIEKMIYKLQYHSLPGAESGIVEYPDLWDITFGPGNPHHVMYIKTCACTNITVDYSGAGRSVFHTDDLWPIVVNLSLTFTEETIHTRKDVKQGIYG